MRKVLKEIHENQALSPVASTSNYASVIDNYNLENLLKSYKPLAKQLASSFYAFYIYLALSGKLTFKDSEEQKIDFFFKMKYMKPIDFFISKSFYFMIKNIHKEKLKYKEFVISCAKEKKLFAFFENDNCLSEKISSGYDSESSYDYESDNSYDERSDLIQVKEKTKTVSKMIDKTTLKFTDILSYGTLFENSLQKNHSKIYQHLVKERLVEDLKPIGIQTKIELNDFQQQFIYNCVVFGDILIPDQCYDGTLSQSTKFRNDQDNEISYGPFSPDNKHTEEDLFRLCKFANDAWKHVFYFVEKFEDNKEILELLNQLEIILLHFHGTTLDVYLGN
nr:3159_t:CDS:2 [Entrophospora candida]